MNAIQRRVAILLFLFSLAATIIFSVGFGTPSWVVNQDMRQGLWQICTQNLCYVIPFENQSVYYYLILALESLSFVSLLATLLLSACLLLSLPISKKKTIYALVATCLISVASITSGAAIYASKTPYQLGYSFILVLIGAGLEILVGVLTCLFRTSG